MRTPVKGIMVVVAMAAMLFAAANAQIVIQSTNQTVTNGTASQTAMQCFNGNCTLTSCTDGVCASMPANKSEALISAYISQCVNGVCRTFNVTNANGTYYNGDNLYYNPV